MSRVTAKLVIHLLSISSASAFFPVSFFFCFLNYDTEMSRTKLDGRSEHLNTPVKTVSQLVAALYQPNTSHP